MKKTIKSAVRCVKYCYSFGLMKGISIFNNTKGNTDTVGILFPGVKHKFYLRPSSSDVSVFDHVFVEKEYDLEAEAINAPQFIIDAGANIGCTSVYFANKFPNALIYAIEPEIGNFLMMKKNCAPYPNIHPIHGAVWKNNVELRIENPGADNWSFRVKEYHSDQEDANEGITIPALTIDELMKMAKKTDIDILKIDIESGEKELFEGDYQLWLPYVKILITELHDRIKPGCSFAFYKAITSYPFNQRIKGWNVFITRQQ